MEFWQKACLAKWETSQWPKSQKVGIQELETSISNEKTGNQSLLSLAPSSIMMDREMKSVLRHLHVPA